MNFAQINDLQSIRKSAVLSLPKNIFLDFPTKPGEPLVLRGSGAAQISEETARKIFAVYVFDKEKNQRAALPVSGTYKISHNQIIFLPDFDFAPGTVYEIEIDSRVFGLNKTHRQRFSIPPRAKLSVPKVSQIYPTADLLPANVLRFYVQFSEPMRRQQESTRKIKLKDENGREISAAFVVLNQELWSADNQRLTILLDPGRIKRGVTANLQKGLIFAPRKSYKLTIEAGLMSEAGVATRKSLSKTFRAAEPDRTPLETESWKIEAPQSLTTQPLKINFDRVLDYALLENCLMVIDQSGQRIEGSIKIVSGERSWQFTPRDKWIAGKYKIDVAFDLEDAAGNRINEALDHDAGDKNDTRRFYEIPIIVGEN